MQCQDHPALGMWADLKAVAADPGWMVTGVFTDRLGSARKGRERRPGEALGCSMQSAEARFRR